VCSFQGNETSEMHSTVDYFIHVYCSRDGCLSVCEDNRTRKYMQQIKH